MAMATPSVLFVCTHNAGRSQMAAGFMSQLSGGTIDVASAGTAPAEGLNPAVVAAMLEAGIDLRQEEPTLLTDEALQSADVVITLGSDLAGLRRDPRFTQWDFPDPAGSRLETVRAIRDAIRFSVEGLLSDLNAPAAA
jgi:arsenate reductase (thioredoxin)